MPGQGRACWAGFYKVKALSDRRVIVSVLVAQRPKCICNVVFFLAPVGLSVFDLMNGGAMLGIEFFLCLGIAVAGMAAGIAYPGRSRQPAPPLT